MDQQLNNLRLGVGLAHAVPGAELRVRRNDGVEYVAANRPGADVDLCSLRQAVMTSTKPDRPNLSRWVQCLGVSGSITEDQSGLFHSRADLGTWWFATLIRQDRIISLLEQMETSDVDDDAAEVVLKPDPGLGVTSVSVVTTRPGAEASVAGLAADVYTACLAEELIGLSRSEHDEASKKGEHQ